MRKEMRDSGYKSAEAQRRRALEDGGSFLSDYQTTYVSPWSVSS